MMRRLALAVLVSLLPWAASGDAQPVPDVDQIVVYKAARSLVLMSHGQAAYTIHGIHLGPQPSGAKHFQGDGRTPEGRYVIDFGNPNSAYHLALHISYPSAADAAYAQAQGRDPGGDIFIHGQPNDWAHAEPIPGDWTAGCISLSNHDIELVWQSVTDGTPIDIEP
jgi:murein L,D-transpeptidase YafK